MIYGIIKGRLLNKNEDDVLIGHLEGRDVYGYQFNEEIARFELKGSWQSGQSYAASSSDFCLIDCSMFIIAPAYGYNDGGGLITNETIK